jgi:hypothetical protein
LQVRHSTTWAMPPVLKSVFHLIFESVPKSARERPDTLVCDSEKAM